MMIVEMTIQSNTHAYLMHMTDTGSRSPTKISGEDTPGTVAYLQKRQHEPLWTVCSPGSETELVWEATVLQTVLKRLQIWVDQKSHQKIVKQDSQMQSKIYQVPTGLYHNSHHHVRKVQQCVDSFHLMLVNRSTWQ